MAYANDPNQDPNVQANAQTPANQPPTTGSAVGAAGGGKSPNQPSNSSAPAPFTNLQSYLDVNAPQIQNTANQVAGQLGNSYSTAKGAIDQAGQNFGAQVNSGYAAPDQSVVNNAAANPTEFAKDAKNLSSFQSQYNDKYAGPSSFETSPDYATAQGQAQNAVNQAQNLGTYSGLQQYLTSNVEQAPTQAISALDTALINQNPNAIQTIQTAAQPLGTLNDYLGTVTGQQNSNVANAQNAAQHAAQYAQNAFTGANGVIPTFENNFNKDLSSARTTALDAANKAKADLANGIITPDEAKLFGLNPSLTQNILESSAALQKDYGTKANLSQYLQGIQSPDVQITPANFATPEQYAETNALSKLTGNDLSSFLNQANAGQAGTANTNLTSFDENGAHAVGDQLRQADINNIASQMNKYTTIAKDLPELLSKAADPKLQNEMRQGLSGDQLNSFNDALTRLHLNPLIAPPPASGTGKPFLTTQPLEPPTIFKAS